MARARTKKKPAVNKRRDPKPARTTTPLALVTSTPEPAATVTDLRTPLPGRRRNIGRLGANEQAATRAALASAALQLPVSAWIWNGSTAQLADGTLLIHNPGPDRTFTAHIACRRGSIHGYPITSNTDLKTARALTKGCERRHTPNTPTQDGAHLDWHKALGLGIQPISHFGEGVKAVRNSVADTQPLSTHDIAGGLTARATSDTDTPKEHPQP